MKLARDGSFSITLSGKELSAGLRPEPSNPRNSSFMIELTGLIGKDRALQVIDTLTYIDTSVLIEGYPFPQLIILTNHMLLCGSTEIYEYDGATLSLIITASISGGTWRAFDYTDFICMSNGQVVITRDPLTDEWSETIEIPAFNAACNFSGQALIGNVNPKET